MKLFYTICLVFFCCSLSLSKDQQTQTQSLFKSCMETFLDEVKCKELVEKANIKSTNESLNISEDSKKLFDRNELKNSLMMKSKPYVLNLLGEPDKIQKDGAGKEYFHYYRPITRLNESSSPDKKITIIFVRGLVSRILHTPSED